MVTKRARERERQRETEEDERRSQASEIFAKRVLERLQSTLPRNFLTLSGRMLGLVVSSHQPTGRAVSVAHATAVLLHCAPQLVVAPHILSMVHHMISIPHWGVT